MGRDVLPFPHNPDYKSALVAKYDQMSCRTRMAEIASSLSSDEVALMESLILHIGGGNLDNTCVLDLLRWWALSGYTPSGINEYGLTYKLKNGQSSLAKAIFAEAVATGSLSYKFSTPIRTVKEGGSTVEVVARDGTIFVGRSLVCTIPLNVLADIEFIPPISPLRLEGTKGPCRHGNQSALRSRG